MQNHDQPSSLDDTFRQPQVVNSEMEVLHLQHGGIPNPEQAIITSQVTIDEHLHNENAQQGLMAKIHGNFKDWFNGRKDIYSHNVAVLNGAEKSQFPFFDEKSHTEYAHIRLYERIRHKGKSVYTHARAAGHAVSGQRLERAVNLEESRLGKERLHRSLKIALGVGLVACRGVQLVGKAKVYGMPQAINDLTDSLGEMANRRISGGDTNGSLQLGTEYAEAFIGTQLNRFGFKYPTRLPGLLQEVAGVARGFAEDPETTIITPKNLRKVAQHL